MVEVVGLWRICFWGMNCDCLDDEEYCGCGKVGRWKSMGSFFDCECGMVGV